MTDEHAALVQALEDERARPERKEPSVEELMTRLIGTLAALWKTRPDKEKK
ncbi:hypothetical protein GCM10010182_67330 [Actinomadura cremea]|nr:hypothetical protein GCM10010182_67330 [Actinomadura cremea]